MLNYQRVGFIAKRFWKALKLEKWKSLIGWIPLSTQMIILIIIDYENQMTVIPFHWNWKSQLSQLLDGFLSPGRWFEHQPTVPLVSCKGYCNSNPQSPSRWSGCQLVVARVHFHGYSSCKMLQGSEDFTNFNHPSCKGASEGDVWWIGSSCIMRIVMSLGWTKTWGPWDLVAKSNFKHISTLSRIDKPDHLWVKARSIDGKTVACLFHLILIYIYILLSNLYIY